MRRRRRFSTLHDCDTTIRIGVWRLDWIQADGVPWQVFHLPISIYWIPIYPAGTLDFGFPLGRSVWLTECHGICIAWEISVGFAVWRLRAFCVAWVLWFCYVSVYAAWLLCCSNGHSDDGAGSRWGTVSISLCSMNNDEVMRECLCMGLAWWISIQN